MDIQAELVPIARVDFEGRESPSPGWYVRYVAKGRQRRERLPIEVGADAFGAVETAAENLGCRADQVSVGGPVWPEPLDGLVDAGGTLEFVSDLVPGFRNREGAWCPLTEQNPLNDNEARRHARREVEDVNLYLPARGRVRNWSERGMGVEIYSPLTVSTRFLFEAKGRHSSVELFGEVRWCREVIELPLGSATLYRVGISLVE